jgi:protein involved in polysaccharide export with SLBB domain
MINMIKRSYILLFISFFLVFQSLGQELNVPNRFLSQRSFDRLDLLGRYYRRAFEQQAIDQGIALQRGIPGLTGVTEEGLRVPSLQEGTIDPGHYVIGPADLFTVSVWSELPFIHTGYVSPDGSLLIPTVGIVPVAGKTLRDVRAEITAKVREKYISGEISVILEQTRMFTVHVGGNIRNPGPYPASPVQRVDRLLALAHMPDEGELQRIQQRYFDDLERPNYFAEEEMNPNKIQREPSLRNIILRRTNGDTLHVDLVRYYATGNTIYNPYLQDGDRIIVRPEDLRSNAVSVYGGVRLPGRFEFHPGDSLHVLLEIVQGFTENAVKDSIEIVRFVDGSDSLQRIVINGNDVLNGNTNIGLVKNDRVFVWERPEARREYTVYVRGEVLYSGGFPISDGTTPLSAIIEAAGGFTHDAAIGEAKVYRQNIRGDWDPLMNNPDYRRLQEMRLSRMNAESREYFNYEAAIRRDIVSVDFRKLFLENDVREDITLHDGDIIVVPKRSNTLYVFGQVANPGYVDIQPGWNVDDYLVRAGGLSEGAKKKDIRVIKAGSMKWVKPRETALEPGDSIWVPRKRVRDFDYYFARGRDILSVTASLLTIYFLIQTLNE